MCSQEPPPRITTPVKVDWTPCFRRETTHAQTASVNPRWKQTIMSANVSQGMAVSDFLSFWRTLLGLLVDQWNLRVPDLQMIWQPWRNLTNTMRSRQNGRHFVEDLLKCIFLNENIWLSPKIFTKVRSYGPINNIPALVIWDTMTFMWRHCNVYFFYVHIPVPKNKSKRDFTSSLFYMQFHLKIIQRQHTTICI